MSATPTSPQRRAEFAWWAPFVAMLSVVFAVTVVALFARALAGLDGTEDDLPPGATLAVTFAQDAFLVVAAFAFARMTVPRVTLATFGWRRPPLTKELLWLVPVLYIVFQLFLQGFGQLVDPDATDDLPTELGARDSTLALIGVAVLVGVVAPFVEELFFRGFLFGALRPKLGWIPAAIIAGALFGLIHAGGTDAVFLVPLALFGVLLCVIYQRTDSLLPGMGLHALNNGLALGSVLDWSVAGTLASAIAPVLVVGLAWVVAPE